MFSTCELINVSKFIYDFLINSRQRRSETREKNSTRNSISTNVVFVTTYDEDSKKKKKTISNSIIPT